MSSVVDLNALRAQTLRSTHEEEAVTVNTRALIDKVLARYSGEHTTLRELLQNAADANASSVEIIYQTANPSQQLEDPKDLLKLKCQRVLVKNDGQAFREEDWQRLKRIAEGNPDETKIGAFGVGFYSVFADCEEPFVSSGNQAMAFYWKGNSLFTRRAKLDNVNQWTTFLLEYREATEIQDLKGLCKFLATSLTFVKLSSISLYIDDHCLLKLNKKTSPSMELSVPSTINPYTESKLMRVSHVTTESVQIDARYMNITQFTASQSAVAPGLRSFFSMFTVQNAPATPNTDLMDYTNKTIFLRIANATVNTYMDRKSAQELERATKKPPPKTTNLAILTMSKSEHDASEKDADIFGNVIPSNAGKVFIGFPTHQTTGIKAHVSAHSVIPTVERESIDLNARVVKSWNVEMLYIAGILSRIIYSDEMATISKQAKGLKPKDIEPLYDDAIHVMKQFTFTSTTPSSNVGQFIQYGFWQCAKDKSIELLSTKGVLPSNKIRLPTGISFLEGLPILPEPLIKGAPEFVKSLTSTLKLVEVQMSDIIDQLERKALAGDQVGEFLKWAAKQRISDAIAPDALRSLFEVAVITDVEQVTPILLGRMEHVVNKSKLAEKIPLPDNTLPWHITKSLSQKEIEALGWTELGVCEWLNFLVTRKFPPAETDFTKSAEFANLMMSIISKNWEKESQARKDYIVDILKHKPCIPTKQGSIRKPNETYFPTVKLFEDLPIHSLQGVKEKVLVALGIRKTVELKIVFDRLMDENVANITGEKGAKWSHVDLIRYLVSVQQDIPADDIKRLKATAICKATIAGHGEIKTLFKVSSLYEPNKKLEQLKLPILQWPGQWSPTSPEALFLHRLGLKKSPDVTDLVEMMAGTDHAIAATAMNYFIAHYHIAGYESQKIPKDIAFLPLEPTAKTKNPDKLVKPDNVFTNQEVVRMGFNLLRKDLIPHASKFKVKSDPDMNVAVERLCNHPPATIQAAREQFAYFTTRINEIQPHNVYKLNAALIVPIFNKDIKGENKIYHVAPKTVFLGSPTSAFASIFNFVDFGPEAEPFLWKVGSMKEPTTSQMAYAMVQEPNTVLDNCGRDHQKYLNLLRTLADNYSTLKKDKQLMALMKTNRFLLASLDVPIGTGKTAVNDDDSSVKEYHLKSAKDIVIHDDYTSFNLFREKLFIAPEEDQLETFYANLGVQQLSSVVHEDFSIGSHVVDSSKGPELQKLINERIRLFIHSTPDKISHDAKWVEKNVRVEVVNKIKLRRSLHIQGQQHVSTQDITAALTDDPRRSHKMLYVTPKYSLFDVSQSLVQILITKPKPHFALLLESFLSTDLMTLKNRGYNVDRILKAKAEQAQVAEVARKKREEERLAVLQEQARAEQEQRSAMVATQNGNGTATRGMELEQHQPGMPGAFGATPPSSRPHSIFQNIQRSLGLNQNNTDDARIANLTQHLQQSLTTGPGAPRAPSPVAGPVLTTGGQGKPTSPHALLLNLHGAINASRAHNSSSVFSPPSTVPVQEQHTYCDSTHAKNIVLLTTMPAGTRVYVDPPSVTDSQSFLRSHLPAMAKFESVLLDMSDVLQLARAAVHIFYDIQGPTIAFNLNGSLFFNLRYFEELHHGKLNMPAGAAEALVYWYVTACHEVAHNLVREHSSDHSFYTESLVVQFFGGVVGKLQEMGAGRVVNGGGSGDGGRLSLEQPPAYRA